LAKTKVYSVRLKEETRASLAEKFESLRHALEFADAILPKELKGLKLEKNKGNKKKNLE
jgi:hypothetical protein